MKFKLITATVLLVFAIAGTASALSLSAKDSVSAFFSKKTVTARVTGDSIGSTLIVNVNKTKTFQATMDRRKCNKMNPPACLYRFSFADQFTCLSLDCSQLRDTAYAMISSGKSFKVRVLFGGASIPNYTKTFICSTKSSRCSLSKVKA